MNMWRKRGPLGKLHNINIWINATEQRLQKFLAYSHNRHIPRDNSIWRNSWQRHMHTATQEEMMEAIDQFLDTFGDSQVALDKLDEGGWEMLDKINAMPSVFMEATKSLEGSAVSLTKGLPAMDFILSKFE
jgi:hypothetical protein